VSTPHVVILAAGASRRLGQPKALVDLPGGKPVTRLVRASHAAGDNRPLVVAGAHFDEIAEALHVAFGSAADPAGRASFELCPNPDWERGRTGSLVAAAARTGAVDLCVLPVDHPRVSAALLRALFDEWAAAGAPPLGWLAPGHRAAPDSALRPGHPVVLGSSLVARLCREPEAWSARPLFELRQAATPLWMLPTEDAAVIENLDRPEDLAQIRADDLRWSAAIDGPSSP